MKSNKTFYFVNILISIVLGSLLYYFLFPNVLFVKKIDDIFHITSHPFVSISSNFFVQFVRNYFLDILWGYALAFSIIFVIDNKTTNIWRGFVLAAVFSICMECLQLTPWVVGTFDLWDIAVEILAELFAVYIIKKYYSLEDEKHE